MAAGLIICSGSFANAQSGTSRPAGRIAYSDGDICLVNAGGSGARRCLPRTYDNYAPVAWSADGRRLAFERHYDSPRRDCCVEVLIMGADGRGKVRLTPRGMEDSGPAWSPVAPRIAFTRRKGYSAPGIYVANADGSDARDLRRDASEPAWSPDGRKIAFMAVRQGVSGTYVINADGTGVGLVRRGVWGAQWSPDGRSLLVVGPGITKHVLVMNVNGSGLRRLTRSCQEDYNAAWSPDGRKIAFTCYRKNEDIYTINVDGTGLQRLTSNPKSDSYPAWSPDGQWIAYVGYKGGENGVWVMRSDGTLHRRITPLHP